MRARTQDELITALYMAIYDATFAGVDVDRINSIIEEGKSNGEEGRHEDEAHG
jgi:hypothetical protein